MKKILSLFIIFCFVISSAVVMAETPSLNDEAKKAGAAKMLFELGIMKGDENGNLNEEKEVTRAEFAALVLRAIKENGSTYTAKFNDVSASHWAADYIGVMADRGIINGYPDGSFGPENCVTLSQSVKILLGVLGESDENFSYPYDYLLKGADLGLTSGINVAPESRLSRETVAKLIINALYIPQKSGEMFIEKADVATYYVSPEGSDDGDGSFKNPWKTLAKAAKSVSGHAVIYLAEGIYEETEAVVVNGGKRENEPLIIRTAFGKVAEIVFKNTDDGFVISENADFVTVENLSFTAEDNETEENILAVCEGNSFTFRDNKVCGMSLYLENAENAQIEGNVFTGGKNAVCVKKTSGTTVCGNTFEGQTEAMLSVINNAKNTKIYNNTFDVTNTAETTALSIGSAEADGGVKASAVWNNVIYNGKKTLAETAISMENTENCHFYNNIIDGTNGAVRFAGRNVNSVLKNNIYLNCSDRAYVIEEEPIKFDSDYNCFYQTYPEINEKNSIYKDPYIVSRGGDWHLMADSPAVLSGTKVPWEIEGADGETLVLDLKDFDGNERADNWHMGIYAKTSNESLLAESDGIDKANLMLYYDFKTAPDHLVASGGDWGASGGVYRQGDTEGSRTTVCYDGGLEWTNFEFSADIEAPNSTEGHASGIIFRSDLEMKNMYTFRFLTYDTLEFAKWQNNSFASIEKWEFPFELDGIYNLKVRAVGSNFVFYVNGEKVREVQDNSYLSGTVGLYCYRETNVYDNMKVEKIN